MKFIVSVSMANSWARNWLAKSRKFMAHLPRNMRSQLGQKIFWNSTFWVTVVKFGGWTWPARNSDKKFNALDRGRSRQSGNQFGAMATGDRNKRKILIELRLFTLHGFFNVVRILIPEFSGKNFFVDLALIHCMMKSACSDPQSVSFL